MEELRKIEDLTWDDFIDNEMSKILFKVEELSKAKNPNLHEATKLTIHLDKIYKKFEHKIPNHFREDIGFLMNLGDKVKDIEIKNNKLKVTH